MAEITLTNLRKTFGAVIIVVFAMGLYRILNRWVEVSK